MVTMTECIKSTGVVLMSNYYLMAYELKTVESVPTLLKLTERFYVGIRRAQLPHLLPDVRGERLAGTVRSPT